MWSKFADSALEMDMITRGHNLAILPLQNKKRDPPQLVLLVNFYVISLLAF